MSAADYSQLPDDLPVPVDDGACAHLSGMALPTMVLPSTSGEMANLAALPLAVIYCYPLTGVPGKALPDGWDVIPGARGCTPESCAFRDAYQEFRDRGAAVFGLSTQPTAYQQELATRLHLPFELLSDHALAFTHALRLPTFKPADDVLVKRLTLVAKAGHIEKVFYPIFPPHTHADEVLEWLAGSSLPA